MNIISETLQNARDLIATPDQWTKRAFARNMFEHQIKPQHPAACKFCLVGAVINASMGVSEQVTHRVIKLLGDVARRQGYRGDSGVVLWNDRPDIEHRHVMALIDKAIEEAKEYD